MAILFSVWFLFQGSFFLLLGGLLYVIAFTLLKRRATEQVEVDDGLLQTEVFRIERLEQYASELAPQHILGKETRRVAPLLNRLEDNERVLTEAYRKFAD